MRWRTALRIIDEENCMPSHCCTLSGLEGNQRKAPPSFCTTAKTAPLGSQPTRMVLPGRVGIWGLAWKGRDVGSCVERGRVGVRAQFRAWVWK